MNLKQWFVVSGISVAMIAVAGSLSGSTNLAMVGLAIVLELAAIAVGDDPA
jgi:hypothetical protein